MPERNQESVLTRIHDRFIADMLLVWQTAIAVKGRNREAVHFNNSGATEVNCSL